MRFLLWLVVASFAIPALACEDDLESIESGVEILGCVKATKKQIAVVNQGNTKKQRFLNACAKATNSSPWCQQLIRPNPDSIGSFFCTYGKSQVHQLIHPDEGTWPNAFKAVKFVEQLQSENIHVCEIYNWWRPEPYNKNVGGAKGRHPFGTSVDVRFCSRDDMEKAFLKLCEWRKAGQMHAVGYYNTTGLHFGIGDSRGNTWGKECPK